MTKYKYSRKEIIKDIKATFAKPYPRLGLDTIMELLLAKQPKQKSTGKVWFEEIPEENILVKKLSKSKPIRPTLQPIEKIDKLLLDWNLVDCHDYEKFLVESIEKIEIKLDQTIDRINLLSEGREI